jgi:hypothetical protein
MAATKAQTSDWHVTADRESLAVHAGSILFHLTHSMQALSLSFAVEGEGIGPCVGRTTRIRRLFPQKHTRKGI